VRLFLALWLVVFAVQVTDLIAAVAPDACVSEAGSSATDSCPQNCARCVCCSRVSVFVPQVIVSASAHVATLLVPVSPSDSPISTVARRILHVPKAL
jgi:hypothetical protein